MNNIIYKIIIIFLLSSSFIGTVEAFERSEQWLQKPNDVFGIGAATVDTYYKISDEEFKKLFGIPYNIKKGEMVGIDKKTFKKLSSLKEKVKVIPSDSAFNVIKNMASFGAKVSYSAAVNDDEYGRKFVASLRKDGVMGYMEPKKFSSDTSRSLVFITPDGERTIMTQSGAHEDITQLDINYHDIKDFKVVFVEAAIWDKSGKLSKTALRSYKIAEKVGSLRVFSLHDVYFIKKHSAEFQNLLQYTDIVFGNDGEAKALFGVDTMSEVIKSFQTTNLTAVITQASEGAILITPNEVIKVQRAPINDEEVIDTSGAGDAFAAGFLYGFISNLSLAECGKLASLSAREVLRNVGPTPKKPFKELLEEKI